ncbi:probable LRR receptor-like serine/threonine-protein kinase At3g47570 [Prosopis cineraria]|uniref:probable LRR receptor-like serine/threonine-protein kinase At3g47570 n=1 Tax=Prosopis cineraria TaxID=364024 RepID=UPI00241058D5|nr:probable LRR receptor-like serine/threonine-protein kinase At3g47570 [Prosopis cineraria]
MHSLQIFLFLVAVIEGVLTPPPPLLLPLPPIIADDKSPSNYNEDGGGCASDEVLGGFSYGGSFVPRGIGELENLNLLDLSQNYLKGAIPSNIFNISTLTLLNLGGNFLYSTLPSYLGIGIPNLRFVWNDLSGLIPDTVNKLHGLQCLSLSSNRLYGSIINELCQLKSPSELYLANNMFYGVVLGCLGNTSLRKLDLSSNKLISHIRSSLWSLKDILVLDISSNALSGIISPESQFQVHPYRKEHKHMSNKLKLVIKCSLPIIYMVVILVVSGIVFLKCKRDHINDSTKRDLINFETSIRISYYELWQGTNGFNESNLLGFGSFGLVYKATLSNSKIVAVKVFKLEMEEALRSFDIECATMCNLCHHNLIKVISCCSNDHFKSLIMEFMENGTLDKWLYSHNYYLNVLQRLNIMIDVAVTLEYLHHGCSTLVVYCDVKPNNVLLDEDMAAHLSDFGIAKFFGEGQPEIYTKLWLQLAYSTR